MKLSKIESNERTVKQNWSLKGSTVDQLEAYRRYYKKVHRSEVGMKDMAEHMLLAFLKDDKDFQRFLRESSQEGQTQSVSREPEGQGQSSVAGLLGSGSEALMP